MFQNQARSTWKAQNRKTAQKNTSHTYIFTNNPLRIGETKHKHKMSDQQVLGYTTTQTK